MILRSIHHNMLGSCMVSSLGCSSPFSMSEAVLQILHQNFYGSCERHGRASSVVWSQGNSLWSHQGRSTLFLWFLHWQVWMDSSNDWCNNHKRILHHSQPSYLGSLPALRYISLSHQNHHTQIYHGLFHRNSYGCLKVGSLLWCRKMHNGPCIGMKIHQWTHEPSWCRLARA